MKRKFVTATTAAAIILSLALVGTSLAKKDEKEITGGSIKLAKHTEAQLPALAQISLSQAIQSATGAIEGQVLQAGLENENGFLVYAIEVASQDKTVTEVIVDAGNGKVLATYLDKSDHENEDEQD